ncbi:hypothetical protein TrVE_jg9231 [Triparma verrucosa]|uniref:GST C-terminal domain-containing protein n=1 Tax=Triparma verrucosa TaxID=1606542 RepID=A0A9W7BN36_9STRA|nr:hypothetical protein TrVE_jg9231 [Triparma verrucosa]
MKHFLAVGSFASVFLLMLSTVQSFQFNGNVVTKTAYSPSSTSLSDRPTSPTSPATSKQFSLNLLKNGPPQTLFLPFVKYFYKTLWSLMLNELTPHDTEGRFLRDYSTSSYFPPTLTSLNPSKSYVVLLVNLRPNSIVEEMDVLASFLFDKLSNGCYRTGFCTSQFAYEEAAEDVKEGLRVLEERLEGKRFIMGEEITEVDVKMFPWACRFDYVYTILFRSPGGKIRDYPNVERWARGVAEIEGVEDTIDLRDAVGSYYRELFMINPGGLSVECPEGVRELFGN